MFSVKETVRSGGEASRVLPRVDTACKNHALSLLDDLLDSRRAEIVKANEADLERARRSDLPEAAVARLRFGDEKIDSRRQALRTIADLPDPVGQPAEAWRTEGGLDVQRVRSPLGLILMIYESRPHVTVNAGAFCLKSGNACLLRGGSEVANTNEVLAELWEAALEDAGIPRGAIQVIQCSHEQVAEMLTLEGEIDLVMPRRGKDMDRSIREQSKVPVLKHEDGICHVFLDASAPLHDSVRIVTDSKCLLPSVCNALETLLVHRDVAATHLPRVADALRREGVALRGCARTREILSGIESASAEDWDTEYLGPILSIRVVEDLDEAIDHIESHGSHHTDSIVTDSESRALDFVERVDSAVTLINASTMFDDGASLGLGAEIGISTDRFHARGPIGLNDLTIPRYVITGRGHAMGEWPVEDD